MRTVKEKLKHRNYNQWGSLIVLEVASYFLYDVQKVYVWIHTPRTRGSRRARFPAKTTGRAKASMEIAIDCKPLINLPCSLDTTQCHHRPCRTYIIVYTVLTQVILVPKPQKTPCRRYLPTQSPVLYTDPPCG